MAPEYSWAMVSFLIGSLAGLSEIVSRYRDEPLRASANRYGLGYMFLNGLAAVAAFGFIVRYPTQFITPIAGDMLASSIVAGFGAMAALRSNFFIFRTEDGKEYPIGPSIVIETFLKMLDRKIDRLRASKRQQRVFDSMKDIHDFNAAANYLEASLLSFQNLTDDEKSRIGDIIGEYRSETEWPAQLRIAAVGFAFLTIAGEENFDQVIGNLKNYLKTIDAPKEL